MPRGGRSRRSRGQAVLVGHSFSGMIVSEVGVDPKISALVYVAARAPDAGEDYTALAKTYPTPPASAGIVFDGDWGQLSEKSFSARLRRRLAGGVRRAFSTRCSSRSRNR